MLDTAAQRCDRDTRERLLDVLEAVEWIERYAVQGRTAFENDELIQALVSKIQIIGEACNALPQDFRARYPEIPWRGFIEMRFILISHHFEIDPDVVRAVLERELPPLKQAVATMLAKLDGWD